MLLTFKISGLVLNRDTSSRSIDCSFTSCEFWADLGNLIHPLCPHHNTLQVTFVGNANQTNPKGIREVQPYPYVTSFVQLVAEMLHFFFNFSVSSLGKVRKVMGRF